MSTGAGEASPGWPWAGLAGALTLAERASVPVGDDDAGEGAARLAKWRAQPPFDKHRWWLARLSAAGLSESALLALAAEAIADLAGRTAPPRWAAEFTDAFRPDRDPGSAVGREPAENEFATVVEPLITRARERLAALLRDICAAERGLPLFDPGLMAAELYAPLAGAVGSMVLRTLVLELNQARRDGQLHAKTGRERYAEFVGMLGDEGHRRALFARYPVLARQLTVEVQAWLDGSVRFATQLAADRGRIAEEFGGGALGPIERVRPGLGDHHRGGVVTSVRWSSGLELVYKPRPGGLEAHFEEFLAWVNGKGLSCPLRSPRCLDRGDHAWVEFIPARPCQEEAERARFYRRQGSLLALLYVLGGNDIHAENLIASGEYPVLVDLETLLQPGLPVDVSALNQAEVDAAVAARDSVLAVGLLPRRVPGVAGGTPVDLSGLGYAPGQLTPLPVPVVRDAGTDTMRVDLAPKLMGLPSHRPVADDAALSVLEHADDVLDGFTEAYRLCQEHRAELAAGPLARFAQDQVRVIVRPTVWYATILQTGFHPEVLTDGLDRERHFDALWRQAPKSQVLAACAEHERADLWRNDIPVFTASANGTLLLDSDHRPVKDLVLQPGISQARARLAELGQHDLERQRWLITCSLATSAKPGAKAALQPVTARPGPADVGTEASRDELLTAASAVGSRLAQLAFRADGSAQWLGVNSARDTIWSVGPVKADLYHGLSGIALFLGFLGRVTGDSSHTVLAREALRTAWRQLDSGTRRHLGGMAGIGGVVYALCELARLWDAEELLDKAEECALRAVGMAPADTVLDFIGGAAGTIAGLASLHQLRPTDQLRHHIQACADRLLATSISSDHGIGWLPSPLRDLTGARVPVVGFAHGNAGIIPSLLLAADILGDLRYRHAAGQALAYEQNLFDPQTSSWHGMQDQSGPDQDQPTAGPPVRPGAPDPAPAWCTGATGIALSRLICLAHGIAGPTTQAEIDAALTVLARDQAGTHCLCHGEVGNIDLFLQAARLRGEPALRHAAARRAALVVTDISARGWKCGDTLRAETPGLLVGLAGIGYGLLRVAAPGQVPSVLALYSHSAAVYVDLLGGHKPPAQGGIP